MAWLAQDIYLNIVKIFDLNFMEQGSVCDNFAPQRISTMGNFRKTTKRSHNSQMESS